MANKFDIHKGTQTVLDDTLYCPATISPTVFKDINAKYRGIFELRVGGRVLNEGGVPWLVGERNFVDNKRVFLNNPDGTAYVDLYTAGGKFIHRWKLFFETYEIVATVEREYEKTFGLRVSTYGSIVIVDTKRPEQERRSPEGGTGVVRNKNYAETKAILEDPTIEAFIDSYRNDHGGVAFEFVDRFIMRKIRNMATNLNLALDRSKAKLVHESVYSMNDFTNKIKRAFMAYDNMSEEELAEIGITDDNLFESFSVAESFRRPRGRMLKESAEDKEYVVLIDGEEVGETFKTIEDAKKAAEHLWGRGEDGSIEIYDTNGEFVDEFIKESCHRSGRMLKEEDERVSLDVSVSDEWDEDGKKYVELVVKKNGKNTPVNVCVVFTDKGEHLDTIFYNTEKNNEDLTENEVAEELDVSVGDIKKLVEKEKIKAMKEFE